MPENPTKTRCISTHVPVSTAQRLKQLSAIMDRSMADLHTEAIEEYIAKRAPQLPALNSAS